MDVNGIGTDATMAEHIAKIKERKYVETRPRGGGSGGNGRGEENPAPRGRGRGGTRGRGRGRGGTSNTTTTSSSGGGGITEFIPTTLGTALIVGYDGVGLQTSLGKPFLRKEMELKMKAICEGRKVKREVVEEVIEQYQEVFVLAKQNVGVLKAAVTRYCLGGNGNGDNGGQGGGYY